MSTRTNVVIVKEGYKPVQLYHHCDGYPSGVGNSLQDYIGEIIANENKDVLTTPDKFGKFLTDPDFDDSFELEEDLSLHSDIEFLYVISLDEETVTCYAVRLWGQIHSDEELIAGDVEDEKECRKVYVSSFDDAWDNVLVINEDYFV